MPDDTTVRSAARAVVANLVGRPVQDAETLISSGLIDSLSILKLIAQMEKMLQVSIPTDTLQPDDFDTVELIVETVQRVVNG